MAGSRLISISEKIIKPFSATPSPLRHYKLSLIDQLMSTMYMPLGFFYRRPLDIINKNSKQEVSQTLEKSLSKTLTSYYPFAGKLKDNLSIECNDMGAKFLNVELNCSVSEVINGPDTGAEYLAFPKNLPWNSTSYFDQGTNYFVVAQLSHFKCGGIAVSACLSHKIGDGCTAINFMNDWATIARSTISRLSTPQWIGASIFPPTEHDIDLSSAISRIVPATLPYITKRYFFSSSKLNALKELMSSDSGGVKNPTRNEVVTALLYKCANTATSRTSSSGSGLFKPSVLIQAVNLRPRLNPPLPNNSAGNLSAPILIKSTDEEQMKIARIVQDLRKEKEQLNSMKHDIVNTNGVVLSAIENDNVDVYLCSSLCNYQLYNADFGWGKPERAIVTNDITNFFLLSDDKKGDGIEALVSLGKEVMYEFNTNKELLEFASPVPN